VSGRGRAARWAAFAIGLALAGAAGPAAQAAASDEVAFTRATALARAGRCPEALAVLAELAAPTAQSAHLRAQCQLDAKDWPAALASLEEAKRLDPATPGVALHLAVARFHMGDYEGSREALDQVEPFAQENPQYHLYRGLVLLQAARSAEAAHELARARTLGPGAVEPGASYYEGLAWAGADQSELARESLDRVIQSAPGTPWALEAERVKASLAGLADARGRVWAFVRAGLEYDDNVRLRGEEIFPSDDGSHDMRGVWLLHGGSQLIDGPGWAAGVQATYYGSAQFDLSAFNEHYPSVGLWYDRRLAEATTFRLSYDIGYAWYEYDPFLFAQTLRPALFHDFGAAGRSELFATVYKYNFLYSVSNVPDALPGGSCAVGVSFCGPIGLDEAEARNRDGWGLASGVEHRLPLDTLDSELIGGVSYLRYSSRGSEYSYDGVGGWLGTYTDLPFGAAFRSSAGYSYLGFRHASTYPNPDDVPNPLPVTGTVYPLSSAHRTDDLWYVAVELEKYITDRWSTSLRWSYLNNHSNVAVFEYDREITGVYVTYRLKR
jgi:tetratricopeptide (TPR) repeat protein